MRRSSPILGLATLVVLFSSASAEAGMPTISLSSIAAMRMEVISFFLMGLLLSALVVKWIWNSLARDFTRLPRISYLRSLSLAVIWGLVFVVVLTMISGARELMTPGAWERDGATYKLKSPPPEATAPVFTVNLEERKSHLTALGLKLSQFAAKNEGRFPQDSTAAGLDEAAWTIPGPMKERYALVDLSTRPDREGILAYEPAVFPGDPLVLLANGEVQPLPLDDLRKKLAEQRP